MHGLNHPKQNKKTELASNICDLPQISYMDRIRKSLFFENNRDREGDRDREREREK